MKIKTISVDSEGLDLGHEVMIRAAVEYVKDYTDVKLRVHVLESNMESAAKIIGSKYKDKIILIPSKLAAAAEVESKAILHDLYEEIRNSEKSGNFHSGYTMTNAIYDVYSRQAHGVLIPGHTGHIVFISRALERAFGELDPNKPQCLASLLPTAGRKERLMIDLGGVVSQDLYKLAILGHEFIQRILKIEEPKVGFLNIGTEYSKGRADIREAALKYKSNYPNYVYGENGYIEADKLYMDNECDVIVADGFTGNCVLKASEGVYKVLITLIKAAVRRSLIGHLLALPMKYLLKKVHDKFKVDKYANAIVLGLTKLVMKCHGHSKEQTLYQAMINMSNYIDSSNR